jgi:hypothetical protein
MSQPVSPLAYASYGNTPMLLPLEGRRRGAAISIVCATVLSVISTAVLLGLQAKDLQGAAERGEAWVMPAAICLILLGLLAMVALVVAAVFFLMWFYRAHQNLRALGGTQRFTSGWAVGWWFIPIGNWFMPFRAMQDIYRGSGPMPTGATEGAISVWWGCWVLSGILSMIGNQVEKTDAKGVAMGMDVVSAGLSIVSCFFVLKLMRWISASQDATQPL